MGAYTRVLGGSGRPEPLWSDSDEGNGHMGPYHGYDQQQQQQPTPTKAVPLYIGDDYIFMIEDRTDRLTHEAIAEVKKNQPWDPKNIFRAWPPESYFWSAVTWVEAIPQEIATHADVRRGVERLEYAISYLLYDNMFGTREIIASTSSRPRRCLTG